MIERRIGYAKDKADVIRRLQVSEESTGPFNYIADVLVFAAALGMRRGRRIPLSERGAEPIRQSVFERQGYDTMMTLIALYADPRPQVLADSDEAIEDRARTFEEYANGGLDLLQEELRGAPNVLDAIVLLVSAERRGAGATAAIGDAFDLSRLIT